MQIHNLYEKIKIKLIMTKIKLTKQEALIIKVNNFYKKTPIEGQIFYI